MGVESKKEKTTEDIMKDINASSDFIKMESKVEDTSTPIRERTDRQSDSIMQNILNASKLLEGRITFEQLTSLDIPNFERVVNNEFANIDRSFKEFKENGLVNAYTKNETSSSALRELEKQTSINQ